MNAQHCLLPMLLAAVLWAGLCLPAEAAEPPRTAPPAAAPCPRDQLTMYGGLVSAYRRGKGFTELRISTDWGTTERVRLRHPGSDDASTWFLIDGAPFTAADWARIERSRGQLMPGMRAAAWICEDGRQPLVDWQPPR